MLLTNTQVAKLHKAFINGSSANVKLSKPQLHKIGQSGGFLGTLLGTLLKTGFPLMKNIPKPLAKSVLILLGLTEAASATDAAFHKKMFGSGTIALIIFSEETNYIMKIFKSLEEFDLLIKRRSRNNKKRSEKTKRWIFQYFTRYVRC